MLIYFPFYRPLIVKGFLCWGRPTARKRRRAKEREKKRAEAKMLRVLKEFIWERIRLGEMSRRRDRMITKMKSKLRSKGEERGSFQHPIVEDLHKMLDEVIFKVVEDAEAERGGSCQVTRTEAKHEGNKEEDLSVSVAAQVLFHLYNGIKYLIYFWFVRYYVFEISHISYIYEI